MHSQVPVVVTEQERVHERVHTGVSERVGEEVCGQKVFTEVEDRPIVKERVERILEHKPVEKQVCTVLCNPITVVLPSPCGDWLHVRADSMMNTSIMAVCII